jgi:protein-tyrosine phosphatase
VTAPDTFVDIHCHLLPGIDDGARSWHESLEMAEIAVADGVTTVVVTPHQLGNYSHNDGKMIRQRTCELQRNLDEHDIPLRVLPGADVRIDEPMINGLRSGNILTLADQGKHVLLELPHELYFALDPVLASLEAIGIAGILSHPERNQGLLRQPQEVLRLVDAGCLMQVTAGSLMGTFGPASQHMAEWMLDHNTVHFLATDAHGSKSRRPLLHRAFEFVAQYADEETAVEICCRNPAAVVSGRDIAAPKHRPRKRKTSRWLTWRKAA